MTLFFCKPCRFSHVINGHVDGLVSMGITCLPLKSFSESSLLSPPYWKTRGTRLFLRMSSWSGYSVVIFLQLNNNNNNSNNKQNKTTHVKHQANSFIFRLLKGFPHFLELLFLSFLVSCSKL